MCEALPTGIHCIYLLSFHSADREEQRGAMMRIIFAARDYDCCHAAVEAKRKEGKGGIAVRKYII